MDRTRKSSKGGRQERPGIHFVSVKEPQEIYCITFLENNTTQLPRKRAEVVVTYQNKP